MRLDESVDIDAPAALAWQVLTDLDRYGEWNPFVVAASSSLKLGEAIHMKVRLFQSFTQAQTETILECDAGRRLCYGLAPSAFGALESHRCHELELLGEARCRYTSHFELRGWIAPLVEALLGKQLTRGFADNTAGVKARTESLAL